MGKEGPARWLVGGRVFSTGGYDSAYLMYDILLMIMISLLNRYICHVESCNRDFTYGVWVLDIILLCGENRRRLGQSLAHMRS